MELQAVSYNTYSIRDRVVTIGAGNTTHEDDALLKLKALLEPFGINQFFTDSWGAYQRHLDPSEHTIGKRNTQTIERKYPTLRTRIKRLVRKTICFNLYSMLPSEMRLPCYYRLRLKISK